MSHYSLKHTIICRLSIVAGMVGGTYLWFLGLPWIGALVDLGVWRLCVLLASFAMAMFMPAMIVLALIGKLDPFIQNVLPNDDPA